MSEVIWSYYYDRHIVRPAMEFSTLTPLFVGTYDECIAYLENLK